MIKLKQLLLSVALFCSMAGFAQAPANDNPCNATVLPNANSTCTYVSGTTVDATITTGVSGAPCLVTMNEDVWFKTTVPAGGTIILKTTAGTMNDAVLAAYTGTCGSLLEVGCDDNTGPGLMPELTLSGLTPGTTLWIRVWAWASAGSGTFEVCASLPPPPPSNDEPCNAILLNVSNSCSFETFTNFDASATSSAPAPGCAGYTGGDVWFKVVVPAAGAIDFNTQAGVMTDGGMAIYSGSCGNLSLLLCDDNTGAGNMPQIIASSLTPGDTIWIRVWENGNNNNGTFEICASIPASLPANDVACTATLLTPDVLCNSISSTTLNAAITVGLPTPTCATTTYGDVWFKAVVPFTGGINVLTTAGSMTNAVMALYTGTSCGILTQIDCDDNSGPGNMPQLNTLGLSPGDTVWIRVWPSSITGGGTFDICTTIPPFPPSNDDPCAPTSITVTPTTSFQIFTNESATPSPGVPAPSCGNYIGGDVWFSVTVPSGGSVKIETEADVITNAAMAVYTGACDNLTEILCNDNGTGMPRATITGQTPGSTLWIRVWGNGNNNYGTFGISASIPPPPPSNDEPCNATMLPLPTDICNNTLASSMDASTTTGVPTPSCGNAPGADVWFKVVVPPSVFGLHIQTEAGTMTNGVMSVYSGSNCGSLTEIGCDDNGNNMPDYGAFNLTPGDTLWIRVWGATASNDGEFSICVTTISSPPPCNTSTPAADVCDLAPRVCDFNGYCGNTSDSYNPDAWTALDNLFSDCLGGASIENDSYVTFIANETTATFNVWVTSSQNNDGIQMMFYEGDCNSTTPICHGGYNNMVESTIPYTVTATDLIPGNSYYLLFDGYAGDVCDYSLAPISGVSILSISPDAPVICSGNNISLTASGGVDPYKWYIAGNTDTTLGPILNVSPSSTTTYTVLTSTTGVGGCPLTKDVTVTVTQRPAEPIVDFELINYCKDAASVALTATADAGNTLNWYTVETGGIASPIAPTPSTNNNGTTNYYVSQSIGSCEGPRTPVTVIVSSFSIEAGGPVNVFTGQGYQTNITLNDITNGEIDNILWSPSSGVSDVNALNPLITPVINAGQVTYEVTVTDTLGCTASDDLVINVINLCVNIKNAFTPNGDGVNDYWQIYTSRDCIKKATVTVFNRYGTKVFETPDYFNNWNGTYKNKPLPDGTYYGVVQIEFVGGKKTTSKTDLTILR